jgi:hypothetical protein
MTLAPLLAADGAIRLHAFAAMAAFVLGVVQFSAPKGTIPHRCLLDTHHPAVGALESDSSVGDFHAGHVARCGTSRPAASRPAASHCDAFVILWCAGDRRAIHTIPGPDHVHRGVRPVTLYAAACNGADSTFATH